MIRALRALLKTPPVQLALAGGALTFGATVLVNVVSELRDQVDELSAQLMRAGELLRETRTHEATARVGMYPAPADVDPLARAGDGTVTMFGEAGEAVKLGNDEATWPPSESEPS